MPTAAFHRSGAFLRRERGLFVAGHLSTSSSVVSSRMVVTERCTSPAVDVVELEIINRNMRICVWCGNRDREACMPCQLEGAYRHLEPAPLESWEQPPELPAMRELVDLPAQERLAFVWLSIRYIQAKDPPGDT